MLLMVGCRQEMSHQPKYTPLAASDFFADGMSARPAVEGTVARGHLRIDERYPVTREVLARGRERFEIFCAPCHGRVGNGDGIVVERGFRAPPSYHIDRLRTAPVEHYFDVITNGFGAMASYASRVPVRDRWAIIAYIRALQLSQSAKIEDVPERERWRLGHE
jgi:mono/diheme cytochrome c family protein